MVVKIREKIAALEQFHNDLNVVLRFEHIKEAYDLRVLTHFQHLDLPFQQLQVLQR